MNRHVVFDKLMVWSFNTFGKRFFERSVDSAGFDDHLDQIEFSGTLQPQPGVYEFKVRSLAPDVPLAVNVLRYENSDAPVVVYNMGGGESPFDGTLKRLYPDRCGVNVVGVEAPYQRSKKSLEESFSELNTYVAMLAMTVHMNEYILRHDAFANSSRRLIAGTSLGGFVANRHHLVYNSADIYAPFVAGTRHGDIFLTVLAQSALVRANPQSIRAVLNFDEAWQTANHDNVFPQLARFDQLNPLDIQLPSYGALEVEIWDGGHMYHVIHAAQTRRRLDELLEI